MERSDNVAEIGHAFAALKRGYTHFLTTFLDFHIVGPDLVSGPGSRAAETNGLPASGSPTNDQMSWAVGIRCE